MPRIDERNAGVLLPLVSLPGGDGIGDLGPGAHEFLDWLAEAGFRTWQILPGGPTHLDGSPYSALSGAAGNPLWISRRRLIERGWLTDEPGFGGGGVDGPIDYISTFADKELWLREASIRFGLHAPRADRHAFAQFRAIEGPRWLDDWSRFESLRRAENSRGWPDWPDTVRRCDAESRRWIDRKFATDMRYHAFVQFAFFYQWTELADAARRRGIDFVGDIPFYPSLQSDDVWSHQELFRLSPAGRPEALAGVPPDYFSEDGQLWGNPVYRWDEKREPLIDFWEHRLRAALRMTGLVRLDHFRAFVDYWEVPAKELTARNGRWVPGPGADLFHRLRERLSTLPFIAEDLGEITDEVDRLRQDLGLPGMQIFQFGFGDEASARRHTDPQTHSVHYTGTHDNDTLRGWFESLDEPTRHEVLRRLQCDAGAVVDAAVNRVLHSASNLAIVPVQDLLGLGSGARINVPGMPTGNWNWRLPSGALQPQLASELRRRLGEAGRLGSDSGL